MDKEFLIRILHTSNRVILPGFGAFLRKAQGGSVVFTPFLKSDDGFLSTELMSEFGISKEDSMEMIEAYVAHIKATLDKVGRYSIDGAGTLIVDANSSIAFSEDMSRQITPPKPEPPKPESPRVEYTAPRPVVSSVPPIQPQQPQQPQPHSAVTPKPITTIRRPVVQTTPPPAPAPQPQPNRIQRPQPPRPVQPQGRPAAGAPQKRPAQRPMPSQQQQPRGERPLPRSPRTPQKGKYDVWLIVAIIAALVAIGLLVFGFITSSSVSELQL
ncbi:MAG: hypothetical protein R3Y49_01170 [Rikenellaceae bacterium]